MIVSKSTTLDTDQFLRRSPVHVIDSGQIGGRTFKLNESTNIMQQAAEVSLTGVALYGWDPLAKHPSKQRRLQRVNPQVTLRLGTRNEHLNDGQRQDQPSTSLRAQPRDGLLQRDYGGQGGAGRGVGAPKHADSEWWVSLGEVQKTIEVIIRICVKSQNFAYDRGQER
jgi:hypothetical protein